MKTIAAGQFKATCLKLMDKVAETAAKDSMLYLAPDEELLSTGARWNAQR